jgi:hypothetical protein
MRRDLARWLDEVGVAAVLGLRSCSELFGDFYRSLLHTTSAVRYPVFVRSRDGSLRNYSGSSPEFVAHPWLREMVETTLANELSALRSAIVVPVGGANRAVTHLQDLGAVDPARCLVGLPHPSPASAFRERYFQAARTHLMSQVQCLDLDAAPLHPGRPLPRDRREGSVFMPKVGSVPEGRIERIVIRLTQGNLNNNHIYLREHLDFFPADAIGAANAHDGEGTLLTLHFEGLPQPVETDIAGDKKIFRCRGDVGRFFAHHGLIEGDHVVIERLSAHEYRIGPAH